MPSLGVPTLMPVTLVPHACCLSLPSDIRIIALRELSLSFSAFRVELNINGANTIHIGSMLF